MRRTACRRLCTLLVSLALCGACRSDLEPGMPMDVDGGMDGMAGSLAPQEQAPDDAQRPPPSRPMEMEVPTDEGADSPPPEPVEMVAPVEEPPAPEPELDDPVEPELEPVVEQEPPPEPSCLSWPASGETLVLDDFLTDTSVWRRVAPPAECPAMTVTAREVGYDAFELCPLPSSGEFEIWMEGRDRLPALGEDGQELGVAINDPLLLVYAEAFDPGSDPFSCMAVNDQGDFGMGPRNSARIERLAVPPDMPITVVATSYDELTQGGEGRYRLSITGL